MLFLLKEYLNLPLLLDPEPLLHAAGEKQRGLRAVAGGNAAAILEGEAPAVGQFNAQLDRHILPAAEVAMLEEYGEDFASFDGTVVGVARSPAADDSVA